MGYARIISIHSYGQRILNYSWNSFLDLDAVQHRRLHMKQLDVWNAAVSCLGDENAAGFVVLDRF